MEILKILFFTATIFTQIQASKVEKHRIEGGNSQRQAQSIPNPHIVNLQNAFPANGFYQYYSVPKHPIRLFLPNGIIPSGFLPPSAPGTGVFMRKMPTDPSEKPSEQSHKQNESNTNRNSPGTGFFTRQIDKDPLKKPSKSKQIYKQKEPQTNIKGSSQVNRSEGSSQKASPNTKKSDHGDSVKIPLIHDNHPPVPLPMAQSVVPDPTVVNHSSQAEEADDSFDLQALPDISVFYENSGKIKAKNGEEDNGINNDDANINRNTLVDAVVKQSA